MLTLLSLFSIAAADPVRGPFSDGCTFSGPYGYAMIDWRETDGLLAIRIERWKPGTVAARVFDVSIKDSTGTVRSLTVETESEPLKELGMWYFVTTWSGPIEGLTAPFEVTMADLLSGKTCAREVRSPEGISKW